jgi:hypothetical protein
MTTIAHAAFSCFRSRSWVALGLVNLVLAVVCVVFGPVAVARAGEWAQATCSDGDEPVPTEGWVHGSLGGYPANTGQGDTCQQVGGSLSLRDEVGYQLPESGPMWVYDAPPFSTIQGGSVTLSLASPGGQAYLATPKNDTNVTDLVLMCTELCASVRETTAAIHQLGGSQLFAVTECIPRSGKEYCSSGVSAEMNIKSATILLANEAKPVGTGFAGTLLDNPASGAASLSFTAHDEHGPGVYRATVQVDGHPVWSGTPDLNEGECVTHSTYEGVRKFRNLQPCPQETDVHTEIQTSELAEGQHQLTVDIEDAAGNKATVYTGTITIDNQPPAPIASSIVSTPPPSRGAPNGDPASEQAILTTSLREPTTFTRTLARSATTLTGHLTTPTGTAIKDAQIQLLQQVAGSSAMTPIANTTTNSNGAWTLKAPKGPSRLLRVAYYSHTLDTVPAGTLDVHERVPAVVSMHAPHRVRLAHAVVFSGQLAGGYVPPGGESVQMEIFYSGRWRTIEVLPTNSHGRWTYKYVFTLGAGASYSFRAVTVPNGSYPFALATSKPVRIRVVG